MEDGESTKIVWSELAQMFQTTQNRPRESALRKARKTEHFNAGMIKSTEFCSEINRKIGKSLYLEVLRSLFI